VSPVLDLWKKNIVNDTVARAAFESWVNKGSSAPISMWTLEKVSRAAHGFEPGRVPEHCEMPLLDKSVMRPEYYHKKFEVTGLSQGDFIVIASYKGPTSAALHEIVAIFNCEDCNLKLGRGGFMSTEGPTMKAKQVDGKWIIIDPEQGIEKVGGGLQVL
jgi:hypothetical protein